MRCGRTEVCACWRCKAPVGLEKGGDKPRQEAGDSVLKRFTLLRFQIMRFVRLAKALISKQHHTGTYAGPMPDWEPWGTEAHLSIAAKGYVYLHARLHVLALYYCKPSEPPRVIWGVNFICLNRYLIPHGLDLCTIKRVKLYSGFTGRSHDYRRANAIPDSWGQSNSDVECTQMEVPCPVKSSSSDDYFINHGNQKLYLITGWQTPRWLL